MPRYFAYADVEMKWPRVTADTRWTGANSTSVCSYYGSLAEGEVDGRLGMAYTTPFSSNNVTVKELSIDCLLLRMGLVQKDELEDLQKDVDRRFTMLIDGTMAMVDSAGNLLATPGSAVFSTQSNWVPTMGVGEFKDMEVDSDRVEAEDDARD